MTKTRVSRLRRPPSRSPLSLPTTGTLLAISAHGHTSPVARPTTPSKPTKRHRPAHHPRHGSSTAYPSTRLAGQTPVTAGPVRRTPLPIPLKIPKPPDRPGARVSLRRRRVVASIESSILGSAARLRTGINRRISTLPGRKCDMNERLSPAYLHAFRFVQAFLIFLFFFFFGIYFIVLG